jgi:hypothetical protein
LGAKWKALNETEKAVWTTKATAAKELYAVNVARQQAYRLKHDLPEPQGAVKKAGGGGRF